MSFYMIPYENLPANPYTGLWYASWSTEESKVKWSPTKPDVVPDDKSTWVIGVIDADSPPEGAVPLAGGATDLRKDLPPSANAVSASCIPSFQYSFKQWTDLVRGEVLIDD